MSTITKKTVFTVTKNGKIFNEYTWDEESRTFSATSEGLIIDFGNESEITFNTGPGCIFKTGSRCTFNTGYSCIFNTDIDCTFVTESYCTFNTGSECTFTTGKNCVALRYDVDGITVIPEGKTIKFNEYGVEGYTEVTID